MKRLCIHCGEEFFMRVPLPRDDLDRLCPDCLRCDWPGCKARSDHTGKRGTFCNEHHREYIERLDEEKGPDPDDWYRQQRESDFR